MKKLMVAAAIVAVAGGEHAGLTGVVVDEPSGGAGVRGMAVSVVDADADTWREGGRRVVALLSGANIDIHLLSRIIDRSLVEHHRLVRFRTHVTDRPGALADLLSGIAAAGGNVVAIEHDRVFKDAGFWEAEVEVTLETRNAQHVAELERSLAQRGYEIEPLD